MQTSRKHPTCEQPSETGGGHPSDGIDDVLLLTALAANVSLAVLARRRPDGSWHLQWHGQASEPPIPSGLLDHISTSPAPTEIPDLLDVMPDSPISGSPGPIRWVLGFPIPDADGELLAVAVLLDPWLRTPGHREDTAIRAAARRTRAILGGSPSQPAGQPAEPRVDPSPAIGHPEPAAATRIARRARVRTEQQRVPLLRSGDVADLFDVTERTVINWATSGKLPSLRTVGGHLRFRHDDVDALLGFRRSAQPSRA